MRAQQTLGPVCHFTSVVLTASVLLVVGCVDPARSTGSSAGSFAGSQVPTSSIADPVEQPVLPYLSTGYRFLVVSPDANVGFEQPGFDDSQFSVGDAAFGSGGSCPLDPSVKTAWPLNTDILLRRTFSLPANATAVKVAVAIDNDVQVFINGVDISGGLQQNEGCAARDRFVFPVPSSILVFGGDNLLAVRARDRGVISYVDLEVRADIPPVLRVSIDIKPGSFPNSINPKSQGVIPVAILTTDSFDATTVDPATVLFGVTGTAAAPVHSSLEDVDADGDIDMILHFTTQSTNVQCGDTSASLTGKTFTGQMIEGSDSIKTAGCE
jgi:hypothetical protein